MELRSGRAERPYVDVVGFERSPVVQPTQARAAMGAEQRLVIAAGVFDGDVDGIRVQVEPDLLVSGQRS